MVTKEKYWLLQSEHDDRPWRRAGVCVERMLGDCRIDSAEYVVKYCTSFGDVTLQCSSRSAADSIGKRIARSNLIDEIRIDQNYVNIYLNDNFLNELDETVFPGNGLKITIEHTSLTPCYPLNLATVRSSLVAEQLRKLLLACGCQVSTRMWIEEYARQCSALRFPKTVSSLESIGKADHFAGYTFARHIGVDDVSNSRMYGDYSAIDFSSTRAPTDSDMQEIVSAQLQTLTNIEINDVILDWESYIKKWVLSQRSDNDLIREFQNSINLGARPSYLMRSTAYYLYLMQAHDITISVVPIKQLGLMNTARKLIPQHITSNKLGDLKVLCYGAVSHNNELDSVRSGRFHSVDDLISSNQPLWNAFTEAVFTVRPSTTIELNRLGTYQSRETNSRTALKYRCDSVDAALLVDAFRQVTSKCVFTGGFSSLLSWKKKAIEHKNCAKNDKAHDYIRFILSTIK